jgi:putative ABC transport system substrate-binding protein
MPASSVLADVASKPRIVWLGSGTESTVKVFVADLKRGLEELGQIDGKNIEFLTRFAENQFERMPALAEEVVRLQPTVIVGGGVDAVVALKKATNTIPIVTPALADAQHLGLIASYSHPGSNVTGIMPYIPGLPSKQIELALEVVPTAAKIGLLGNRNDPKVTPQLDELNARAQALGISAVVPEVTGPQDVEPAIRTLGSENVDAVIVLESTMLLSLRQQIALMMAAAHLPAVYGYRQHVDEGGLISYGVDLHWCFHRLATYVDKILKGASPGDLPVEFPTKLELTVNLSASKALGLTLPPTLLARADEVIE